MDQVQFDGLSRRVALQRGLGAITGAALAGVAGTSARAAETKLAKSAVQYVDAGKDEGKDCDDCSQFVPGKTAKANGSCKLVEGVINPHGHCIAFTPKPKK
jgi:phosphoribosylformylglycinamidine (FGAM) synthase-like amidotransferase family enzyme